MEYPTFYKQNDDTPPPIPTESSFDCPPPLPFSIKCSNNTVDSDLIEKVNPSLSLTRLRSPLLQSIAVISFILCSTYAFTSLPDGVYPFHSLSRPHLKNLTAILNHKGAPKFRIVPDNKGKGIWISSNIDKPMIIEVFLESLKGKILSLSNVEATSKGVMKNGRVYLKKFALKEGRTLSPGSYNISIKAYPYYGKMPSLLKRDFLSFSTKFDFFPGTPKELEKRLVKYRSQVRDKRIFPLRDQFQRYKTYKALIDKVDDMISQFLIEKKGPDVKGFESEYNRHIGPVLQRLIIDNNRQHISQINNNPTESRAFETLLDHGKNLGYISSEIVRILSKSPKAVRKVISTFRPQLGELKKNNFNKQAELQFELNLLNFD